jgi:hypothetical protein
MQDKLEAFFTSSESALLASFATVIDRRYSTSQIEIFSPAVLVSPPPIF